MIPWPISLFYFRYVRVGDRLEGPPFLARTFILNGQGTTFTRVRGSILNPLFYRSNFTSGQLTLRRHLKVKILVRQRLKSQAFFGGPWYNNRSRVTTGFPSSLIIQIKIAFNSLGILRVTLVTMLDKNGANFFLEKGIIFNAPAVRDTGYSNYDGESSHGPIIQ